MNILVCLLIKFNHIYGQTMLDVYLEVDLLGHRVCTHSDLVSFPKSLSQIIFQSMTYVSFSCSASLSLPVFPILVVFVCSGLVFVHTPTPVLLPGKSHGQRSLVGCSPQGRYESDKTERFHFHLSLSCIGEGNGNPLQCSCLENPRDGRAWWAAVCGVTQSQTRLTRLSSVCVHISFWFKYAISLINFSQVQLPFWVFSFVRENSIQVFI